MVAAEFSTRLDVTYKTLREGLKSNPRDYDWRISQLRALKFMLEENDEALSQAMWKDLRKSKFECSATEQGAVLSEIALTIQKLKSWMRPRRVSTPLYNFPGRSRIVNEPLGLTLIIGAWNYPINLLLTPLIGAIAGGNAAILKPSEISANTADIIAELIPKYLDPKLFAVIKGGVEETGLLLDKPFDKIFFTGSGPVGKIILAKAAVHLTPTTLELGGKSPAIVWKDADLTVTARRIAWGKFMNAGQTCVAPDYLIVHPDVVSPLITELRKVIVGSFGVKAIESPDYCRIVNTKNFDRLQALAKDTVIVAGGAFDRDNLYIEPTIVRATPDSKIMQEEIFGPILPILEMSVIAEITEFISNRDKPLALYLFSNDDAIVDAVTRQTSSGAVCVNDNVIHMPEPSMPFGGVGASGMGNYHGRFSFETFTHAKGVLRKSFWFDVPVRYAPYTNAKANLLRWLFN